MPFLGDLAGMDWAEVRGFEFLVMTLVTIGTYDRLWLSCPVLDSYDL